MVTAAFGFITKDNVANLFGLSDEAKILGCTSLLKKALTQKKRRLKKLKVLPEVTI